MASISTLVDRVKIVVLSSGSGPFALGAPVAAYRGVEALADGATYSYAIESGSQYEAGTGVYLAATNILVRTPQISSNGGSAVPFPANVQLLFTALAQDLVAASGGVAVVQSPGNSQTAVMSQQAVTQGLNSKYGADNPDGFVDEPTAVGAARRSLDWQDVTFNPGIFIGGTDQAPSLENNEAKGFLLRDGLSRLAVLQVVVVARDLTRPTDGFTKLDELRVTNLPVAGGAMVGQPLTIVQQTGLPPGCWGRLEGDVIALLKADETPVLSTDIEPDVLDTWYFHLSGLVAIISENDA
jgi:hypothetical protein